MYKDVDLQARSSLFSAMEIMSTNIARKRQRKMTILLFAILSFLLYDAL